ncbi:class B sortase [Anaerotalea alkaliphila]|uniref:Class B sortase n=1 Tax=Anaerotalea alkaliphila TaxID=2662126 RepID=A0A7X5HYB7_9FIRM|nr:class B sortase [Anaerotalea alkaliphila]NDL68860.1 class B sortase [Anaerotalea alkaliphila]
MKRSLSAFLFVLVLYLLGNELFRQSEVERQRQALEELRQLYGAGEEMESPEEFLKEVSPPPVRESYQVRGNPQQPLFDRNSGYVGWVRIPGTKVDHPVVRGVDNEFYLDHNFDKEKDKAGSIFMDYRNVGNGYDKHMILYGHNLKDDRMFGELGKYADPLFLEANPLLEFEGLFGTRRFAVFAAYFTDADFYFIETRFEGEEYGKFLETIQDKSVHAKILEVGPEDKILTLATCSYEVDNGRFVVHGVEIK